MVQQRKMSRDSVSRKYIVLWNADEENLSTTLSNASRWPRRQVSQRKKFKYFGAGVLVSPQRRGHGNLPAPLVGGSAARFDQKEVSRTGRWLELPGQGSQVARWINGHYYRRRFYWVESPKGHLGDDKLRSWIDSWLAGFLLKQSATKRSVQLSLDKGEVRRWSASVGGHTSLVEDTSDVGRT